MARHALENPTRHRSQMSGEQRKRSASKKSARAIAASHRRQADASYEAMLEAQDDAWEGGEYQGRYAYQNPFLVTLGGQAVGVPDYSDAELEELHSRGLTIPVRGRRFDRSHHRRAAAGAAFAEEEGFTLTIKKVGDEYRIIDNHGNDLQKYAYRLEKAQEILEKLLAKQA